MVRHWENILEKLTKDGWRVRWIEATQAGETGWTATATREKERHSIHTNDLTLAFQELEASCRTDLPISQTAFARMASHPAEPPV